jgi:tRNA(adenine34) deaminase
MASLVVAGDAPAAGARSAADARVDSVDSRAKGSLVSIELAPAILDAAMAQAIDEARRGPDHGDVPIGAVVVRLRDGAVVSRRHNERETSSDPTAHAEVLALRDAAAGVGSWRLDGHALVVTLEPCAMCAGAAAAARIGLVAFGAADPKAGALGSLYHLGADPRLNHEFPVLAGVRADECAVLLSSFFAARRT